MTVIQEAMFQVQHLPRPVTQVSKETVKCFSHSKRVGGYLLGRTLGVGSFAKVKESLHLATGEKAAVKIIDKKRAQTDNYVRKNLRREGKLLQSVRHPNIVALLEIMETDNSYYLVTELCRGGDLMDYISAKKRLQEKEVLKFIRQIVSAVDYLHKLGIIHRDLKIENLLLDTNQDIKLIDFGLSNFVKVSSSNNGTRAVELCNTQCGSPAYAAPELLNHESYGLQVDSWSIGVNMFAMLTGGLPFTVEPFNIKALYVKMRDRQINPLPAGLSRDCRDLLHKFLTPDPAKRVTIEQALVHRWITQGNSRPVVRVPCPNRLRPADLNTEILAHMSDNLGFRMGEVIKFVTCNTPSSACATYNLYLNRLRRYEAESKSLTKTPSPSAKDVVNTNRGLTKDAKTVPDRNNNAGDTINDERDQKEGRSNNNKTNNNANNTSHSQEDSDSQESSTSSPTTRRRNVTARTSLADDVFSDSPLSAQSDVSDRKENCNPTTETPNKRADNSHQLKGSYSPRPTSSTNRSVLKRPIGGDSAADKSSTGRLTPRPRLYKRRGEVGSGAIKNGTIPKLDLRNNKNVEHDTAVLSPAQGNGYLAPPSLNRSSELQLTSKGALSHLSFSARSTHYDNVANDKITDAGQSKTTATNSRTVTATHKSDTARLSGQTGNITSVPRQSSGRRRQNLPGQVSKKENIGVSRAGSVQDQQQEHTQQYVSQSNKVAYATSRRAAIIKSVEVKPAPVSSTAKHVDNLPIARLQTIQDIGKGVGVGASSRDGNISHSKGSHSEQPTIKGSHSEQPTVRPCRIIPRPFVPFRSAHDRSNGGISQSLSHPFRQHQKSRTSESLPLRTYHGNNTLAPEDTGHSYEVHTSVPPKPVIVRKRLAKRHRLGEVPSVHASLIQDIEHSVTTNALHWPESHENMTGKSPRVNDSLPSIADSRTKSRPA